MTSRASDLILARLHRLHPKSIDLSLGRVERLLAALGHPEMLLPPVVHIAGTNGKGSTLAMLAAMLQAGGHRVDRYISPHLVRFNERILKHGTPLDEAALAACLERCEDANDGAPITFFEITTAAAFLAFAEAPADWVLLETGLGGRLDATNVVARPRLCLISPVSMDHESYLGDTIGQIAFEKAGILKPGVPAVIGPQRREALAVIEARAAAVGAPLLVHGRDWAAHQRAERLVLETATGPIELPRPALEGVHQIDNAGLAAMAALQLVEAGLDARAIGRGLREARWPARLQRLAHGPMVELVPPGTTVWLDGGHNPAAGQVLADSLGTPARERALHLVVGMLSTKDLGQFLSPLVPLAASVRFVPVPGEALSRDPEASAATAGLLGARTATAGSVLEAVQAIVAAEPAPYDILICGSLYLAGDVLRSHG
ncbi:MAG TPA: folylpolyglutamate synthase/dihydrofolate synthase family protein [Geminicoccaceae bacterium]|nr:folylpolyglutamate synthase/dihydrofolate synthase family protein [Geminicoccaceae bacterium]